MALKRTAPSDFSSTGARSFQKRRKGNSNNALNHKTTANKPFKKAHPVNDLKSQIRSLTRLLSSSHNENLPADVRIEKERALQTAREDLERAKRAQSRSEIIGKYHKIRFFDRQKATRRLKKAQKELRGWENERRSQDGDESAQLIKLREQVEEAQTEINYAQYYPLEQPYVPLFPTKRKSHDDDPEKHQGSDDAGELVIRQGDIEMWNMVKKCRADGTLDDLREGRLTQEDTIEVKRVNARGVSVPMADQKDKRQILKKSKALPSNRPTVQTSEAEHRSDEESDGGFFE